MSEINIINNNTHTHTPTHTEYIWDLIGQQQVHTYVIYLNNNGLIRQACIVL